MQRCLFYSLCAAWSLNCSVKNFTRNFGVLRLLLREINTSWNGRLKAIILSHLPCFKLILPFFFSFDEMVGSKSSWNKFGKKKKIANQALLVDALLNISLPPTPSFSIFPLLERRNFIFCQNIKYIVLLHNKDVAFSNATKLKKRKRGMKQFTNIKRPFWKNYISCNY